MGGNNVITATSISPKVILSQQLGGSDAALFTVPALSSAKIAQGSICNVSGLTAAPTLTLGTTSATGGTLAAGTYYMKVTAKSLTGETLGSNEVTFTTTGTTSSQPLSWTGVNGASSYALYIGTAAGAENVLVATVTGTSYTVTTASGTTASPPTTSTFAMAVAVFLSLVQSGGTLGDGTHRVIYNQTIQANDTLLLKDFIGGAMLGPGDAIAGYASVANVLDIVVTGTVHA
jgi:hypothetical protein